MSTKIQSLAYRLLPRRLWFRKPLRDKLLKKYPKNAEEIDQILDQFEEDGHLDDRKHGKQYIEFRLSTSPRGIYKLQAELREKGVGRSEIQQIFEELQVDEIAEVKALVVRRYPDLEGNKITPQERLKISRFLAGRGFSFDAIREGMKECFTE